MKKFIISLSALCLACFYFWSCEKDDICAEDSPTTPNMVVKFYNIDNQEVPRTGTYEYWLVESDVRIRRTATDSILIPLVPGVESSKWGIALITNAPGGGENYNTDFIEFKYTTNEVYVSRACGYKSLFYLNESTGGLVNPIVTDTVPSDNLWIQQVDILQTDIENENEPHVQILY